MPAPIAMAGIEREGAALRAELLAAIAGVVDGARFILGPQVTAFESEMSARLGGAHVVGCASGTDALVLALRALDIGPGDEVIVPAFSYAATAEAVVLAGATPVFADIEADSFAIRRTRRTSASITAAARTTVPIVVTQRATPESTSSTASRAAYEIAIATRYRTAIARGKKTTA